MDAIAIKELLIGVVSYALELNYRAVRFLLHSLQGWIWNLDKMTGDTVEILKIVYRKKNYHAYEQQEYLWTHERFDKVDILHDDHWLMHRVTYKYAYFIRLPEPAQNYSAVRDPFVWIPTFHESTHLARMQIEAFKEYWGNRPIKGRTAVLHNSSRCGSTLLMKMLTVKYDSDRVVTLSEPDVFVSLQSRLAFQTLFHESDDEYGRTFRASIRALGKHIREDQLLVAKCFSCELIPHFHRFCPEVTNLCLYRRDVPAMLRSLEKTIIQLDRQMYHYRWTVSRHLRMILPILTLFGIQPGFQPVIPSGIAVWPRNFCESAATQLGLGSSAKSYLSNKKAYALPVIFYEDLVARPFEIIAQVFDALKIPNSLSVDSVELTKGDSQRGTFLNRKNLAAIQLKPNTDRKRLQKIAQYYGLNSNFFLEIQESLVAG